MIEALQASCPGSNPGVRTNTIDFSENLRKYLDRLSIEGKSKKWEKSVSKWLQDFIKNIQDMNEREIIDYLKDLQSKYNSVTYRKRYYQIRRYLSESCGIDILSKVRLPPVSSPIVKNVRPEDIKNAIAEFHKDRGYHKFRAFILLGASSGLRPSEIFALTWQDIDLENRKVTVNRSKTGKARIAFFDLKAQTALKQLIYHYGKGKPFPQTAIARRFCKSELKPKQCRKFFSQEWSRRGGPTDIKKILMGHSFHNDVDLQHYNYQSEDDLKKIYDRVMN
jgi:integrase/recombinase XerD